MMKFASVRDLLKNILAKLAKLACDEELLRPIRKDISELSALIETQNEMDQGNAEPDSDRIKLQELFKILPTGVAIFDKNRQIKQANPKFIALFEISQGEAPTNQHIGRVFYRPDGTEMILEEFPSYLAIHDQATVTDVRVGMKDLKGGMRWLKVSATPIPASDSECVVVISDITELVKMESLIQQKLTDALENKRQLELIADHVPGPISRVDRHGRFLFANKIYETWFGRKREDIIGRTHREVLSPEVYEHSRKVIEAALHGIPAKFESEFNSVNGERLSTYVMFIPYVDSMGSRDGFFVVVHDITERKRAERMLLEESNRLESLVTGLNQSAIVAITDTAGDIVFVNDHFCEVSGYSREELIGKNHRILNSGVHPPAYFEGMWRAITEGNTWHGEVCNRRKDGKLYWVYNSITPITGPNNEKQYLTVNFDVTIRKDIESSLRHNSKLASLGEMAGGVAHEINNPLTIIKGKAEEIVITIQEGDATNESTLKAAEKIILTTERITKIVKGLRQFSRQAEGDSFESVSLQQLISDTLGLCAERFKNNGVQIDAKGICDTTVFCRETQISQVILNLLNNAFDATQEFEQRWIKIAAEVTPNSMVQISVTDSGKGIAKEHQDKIMLPFFTTKALGKGTGLGLSISLGIMEANKGKIYLDKTCTNTRFILELPISDPGGEMNAEKAG